MLHPNDRSPIPRHELPRTSRTPALAKPVPFKSLLHEGGTMRYNYELQERQHTAHDNGRILLWLAVALLVLAGWLLTIGRIWAMTTSLVLCSIVGARAISHFRRTKHYARQLRGGGATTQNLPSHLTVVPRPGD